MGVWLYYGKGKVFSLENGNEYTENTREDLNAFNLGSFAEVIPAPLSETRRGCSVIRFS